MNWFVVGLLGGIAVALGVWVIVLQSQLAQSRVREQQLREQLDDTRRANPTDTVVVTAGFHDLPFGEAVIRARVEGKPVLALFFTETSGPGMAMERDTWSDRAVQDWLRAKTIAIKINADREPDLAVRNKITGLPVVIFFTPGGPEIGRVVGYYPAQAFIREATAVVNRIKE